MLLLPKQLLRIHMLEGNLEDSYNSKEYVEFKEISYFCMEGELMNRKRW